MKQLPEENELLKGNRWKLVQIIKGYCFFCHSNSVIENISNFCILEKYYDIHFLQIFQNGLKDVTVLIWKYVTSTLNR